MLKEASVGRGNTLYYGGCDINISTLQSVTCVFFNQDMMDKLELELPYQTAREGKWTYDSFNYYMKEGANLNGDASWTWNVNGDAVYGMISYHNSAIALLMGANEKFIITDKDGWPEPAIEGERFISVLYAIEDMLTVSGSYILLNNDHAAGNHYEPAFKNGRALMAMGELKASDVFRDMEATFGVVPVPKYDEKQENYYCQNIFATPLTVIPVNSPDPEYAGGVVDALAYVSYRDVTPVLFDSVVSQKRLRNEESIEMLNIIRNSGSFNVGSAYGWTNTFYDVIGDTLGNGKTINAASEISKNIDKILVKIDETMELMD